jgi:hypothetical protein
MRFTLVAALAIAVSAVTLPAQSNVGGRSEVFAGSTFESYLRYLQTLDKAGPYPVSVRGFSAAEIDLMAARDSTHPWARRYSFQSDTSRKLRIDGIRPSVGLTFNTTYPFGGNDGVVWNGKGLTSTAQVGVAIRWGVLSATLAPVVFRSENEPFQLATNGQTGNLRYNDALYTLQIDRPQRFGPNPYGRFDLGESTIRVDALGFALGASTASQWWGPTTDFPFVLGNNAGGFPHAFFGTSKPADFGVIQFHGRLVYGMLDQSKYSPVTGPKYFESFQFPGRRRFMAGVVGTAQFLGAKGLEVGGTRFFHAANPKDGLTAHNLGLPIQNIFKGQLRNEGDTVNGDISSLRENQLASLFFRWAPPGSGFDVYGEYGREDFSADLRDLFMEPEHSATTSLGFRKAWMTGPNLNAVRAEGISYEASAGSRLRGEGQVYIHGTLFQGHTNRGQMLGANVGPGSGSAQVIAYERFTSRGRMTAFISRTAAHEQPGSIRGQATPIPRAVDALNSLGLEVSRFLGPFDITGKLILTKNINRNFLEDQSNATFGLVVRQDF